MSPKENQSYLSQFYVLIVFVVVGESRFSTTQVAVIGSAKKFAVLPETLSQRCGTAPTTARALHRLIIVVDSFPHRHLG